VLTLGAVKFDPYRSDINAKLYIKPDADEQINSGRHVDNETVEWWSKQEQAVQDEAFSIDDRISINRFCDELNRFLVGVDNFWSQGPLFDIIILENLYKQIGKPTPWNFWQISDSRTLFKVHGDPRPKNRATLHNAMEDCISQAEAVQKIYYRLELEPRFGKK
jgi:3' exoribonuclease, RNase T-like